MRKLKTTSLTLLFLLFGFFAAPSAFALDDYGVISQMRVASNSQSQALLVWLDGVSVCEGQDSNARLSLTADNHEGLRSAALAALLSGRSVHLKTNYSGGYCYLQSIKFTD